ncbi:hypothetical protein RvY_08407 [Ramazzottius varieornatus]|uniref:Uncharacterized protein n=1 Tax=Ramazzottius varieornatus TaxID=947166 RepID=A0A1D1VBC2_RAMVA|nr:hypothetical protein RvY_08407 [Ramazzottius varieornatus]
MDVQYSHIRTQSTTGRQKRGRPEKEVDEKGIEDHGEELGDQVERCSDCSYCGG